MKVKSNEDKPLWVMSDFEGKEIATFVCAENCKQKNGQGKYLRFEFTNSEHDQIFVSGFAAATKKAIALYGEETEDWKGKQFKIYVKNSKTFIDPIEEEI